MHARIGRMLRFGYVASSGRNFMGRICIRQIGGGNQHKKFYVDFYRRQNAFGYLSKIQKSAFYTGFLGLIVYQNGICNYTLLSENLCIGERIYSGSMFLLNSAGGLKNGSSLCIEQMPLFSLVSNIELKPFKGGQLSRAAGTSSMIVTKSIEQVTLKLKSGWRLSISPAAMCSLGLVSNALHRFSIIRKAGLNRALGVRPKVRGVAMNPCDHPHGGGEGRKSPLKAAKSPWG